MNENVMLSVVIISYNQEKYIRDAIESVLNQKTNYKYELILADDCSPDNTKVILKEYQKKYPSIIKVLSRPKNMGATNNLIDACSKTSGKYIALLEGDDYWCDDNKVQEQIDFLEKNEEYIGISHLQRGINLDNKFLGNFPKWIKKDCDMTIEKCIGGYNFSSTSTIYRNIYLDSKMFDDIKNLFLIDKTIGDIQLCMYLLSMGKVRILAQAMMVYRIRNNSNETNYNSTVPVNEIQKKYLNIYARLDKFFHYKYSFYERYKECISLGIAYDIVKLNFKDIQFFKKICPKKYKIKIFLLFPFTCMQILYRRFIKK